MIDFGGAEGWSDVETPRKTPSPLLPTKNGGRGATQSFPNINGHDSGT